MTWKSILLVSETEGVKRIDQNSMIDEGRLLFTDVDNIG